MKRYNLVRFFPKRDCFIYLTVVILGIMNLFSLDPKVAQGGIVVGEVPETMTIRLTDNRGRPLDNADVAIVNDDYRELGTLFYRMGNGVYQTSKLEFGKTYEVDIYFANYFIRHETLTFLEDKKDFSFSCNNASQAVISGTVN